MGRHANTKPSALSRVLGVLGELLITAGVVVLLFVVWQIWWTDIIAGREQGRLVSEFRQEVGETEVDQEGTEYRGDPPLVDVDAIRASLNTNEIWGIMHVPAFGDDYEVGIAEGTDLKSVLDKGSLGHYENTQLPGELGNFALAGHRQSYGAALRQQPDLEVGDALIVETAETWYVYRVTEHEVVAPSAIEVLAPVPGHPETPADGYYLTLTTCHPPFVSNERWITYAELDYWMPRDEGTPKEL